MFRSPDLYELDTPGGPLLRPIRGANQFLGHQAAHHDSQSTVGPGGNTVQAGQLPRAKSGPVGANSQAKPMGASKPING